MSAACQRQAKKKQDACALPRIATHCHALPRIATHCRIRHFAGGMCSHPARLQGGAVCNSAEDAAVCSKHSNKGDIESSAIDHSLGRTGRTFTTYLAALAG